MDIKIVYMLHEWRIKRNMSSGMLAKKSGVGKTTINDIENNRHHPTVLTLCMLAKALDVKPESLFSCDF